jgi:hypothetical protein
VAAVFANNTGQLSDPSTAGLWLVFCTDAELEAMGAPATAIGLVELPPKGCPYSSCFRSQRATAARTTVADAAVGSTEHLSIFAATVRAPRRRLSALRIFHSRSVLYGAFV